MAEESKKYIILIDDVNCDGELSKNAFQNGKPLDVIVIECCDMMYKSCEVLGKTVIGLNEGMVSVILGSNEDYPKTKDLVIPIREEGRDGRLRHVGAKEIIGSLDEGCHVCVCAREIDANFKHTDLLYHRWLYKNEAVTRLHETTEGRQKNVYGAYDVMGSCILCIRRNCGCYLDGMNDEQKNDVLEAIRGTGVSINVINREFVEGWTVDSYKLGKKFDPSEALPLPDDVKKEAEELSEEIKKINGRLDELNKKYWNEGRRHINISCAGGSIAVKIEGANGTERSIRF